ncbi:hypothetical protein AJ87_24165 [Rhizobium yanglingense]|nr:hypothetical protein AJ87_24165 [Rhizobium yanglingense]
MYFTLPEAGITLPSLLAGILGLALVYSAYLAEVFRLASPRSTLVRERRRWRPVLDPGRRSGSFCYRR